MKILTAEAMREALSDELVGADYAQFAVAFVSTKGLSMISAALEKILLEGNGLEFIVGLDGQNTQSEAVERLFNLKKEAPTAQIYCYLSDSSLFHPKLYIIHRDENTTFFVGSSNLTSAAMSTNIEVNLQAFGDRADGLIQDVLAHYNHLKFEDGVAEMNDSIVVGYRELWRHVERPKLSSRFAEIKRELKREILNQASKRPRKIIPSELQGWTRLVYEYIQDEFGQDEFETSELYPFEDEFQREYPQNQNIRPKIRQQLQILAKRGYLEDVGRGRWRKVK